MLDFLLTKKVPEPPTRPSDFNEGDYLTYVESTSRFEADKRMTEVLNAVKIVVWTLSIVLTTFVISFVSSDGFRMLVWDRLFSPNLRVESMKEYLVQPENANTKSEFLRAVVDENFQNTILVEKLAANRYEDVGLEQFPKIESKDIFTALGKAEDEELAEAFDTEFLAHLETRYKALLNRRFITAQQAGTKELEKEIIYQGEEPVSAVIKTAEKKYYNRKTSCGMKLLENELQVEIALPWDIWNDWRKLDRTNPESGAKFVHLQCRRDGIPPIFLSITASNERTAASVRLVGVTFSEKHEDYQKRMKKLEMISDNLGATLNSKPIELRITPAVARELEFSDYETTMQGQFVVSLVGTTTREEVLGNQ